MNFKSISFYLSLFTFPISILAFVHILYSYYFNYFLSLDSYIIVLIFSLITAFGLYLYGKNSIKKIQFNEQIILIILIYVLSSFFISIPFYLSDFQIKFISSFFEAISGITGTGFSIFKNIKYLDPTLILWRSSSQWIGGLYFLVFLTILFSNKIFNFKMTNLSYLGDSNLNSEESIKNSLLRIFILYVVLSIFILILLNLSGIRLFNSLNLSMTLISAGGFLPSDILGEIILSNFLKIILILSFLITLLNFYLPLNIFNKKLLLKYHREDFYLILLSIVLILFVILNNYKILDIIISILSCLVNSGISIINSDSNLGLYFLLITVIGGSIISNTSGIKLVRIYILLKITSYEILKLVSPNSIINKSIFNSEIKITDDHIKVSFLIFISFFLSLFILSGLLIFDDIGFEKSFKLSILTLTNTASSEMFNLQNINFSNLLTSSKISLIIFMIIGKIELISIFLIFNKLLFKK